MKTNYMEVLRELCLTPAPSGFEHEIVRKVRDCLSLHCERVEVDPIGNVVGKISGRDHTLRPILINAHMDRVGFIVSFITQDGYLKLCGIGTPNEKVLPGLTLSVRKKDCSGWVDVVVGTKCAHLLTPDEAARSPRLSDVMIDTGVDSADEVRALGIEVGSPAVFSPAFRRIAGTRVCGTAMDNCASVAALVGIAELLQNAGPERDVYLAGNVWEEYNQRATALLVRRYSPVAVISMDTLLAGDTPDVRGQFHGAVGKGPMVSCYNYCAPPFNGCIAHPGLYQLAEETAGAQGTGLQRYVCVGGYGDNAYAQLEVDGPAVIEIGSAVRYAHSSCEVVDVGDIEKQALLVAGMARALGAGFRQNRFE